MSRLDVIVRQAEGNPIIAAAHRIRASQDHEGMDWAWTAEARSDDGRAGVFAPPRNDIDAWIRKAFTGDGFAGDPDFARYLCYRNDRVAEVNARVRRWIHGRTPETPFLPGELALIRSPLVIDNEILIATNEEVEVVAIEADQYLGVAVWSMKVKTEAEAEHEIRVPRDMGQYQIRLSELSDACRGGVGDWDDFHDFKKQFIAAQSIYALTIHNSQGSTFRFAFLDIGDVRRRIRDNEPEAKKLLYTGATRPSDGLILVGA